MSRASSVQVSGLGILAAIAVFATGVARPQNFTADRLVVSCGGGASTSGPFGLTSTIGQLDAGPRLAAGLYTMDGGLWSVTVESQTPEAPLLRITLRGGEVAISWPAWSAAFVLEVTDTLATPNSWQPLGQTPMIGELDSTVAVPVSAGSRFYRLRQVGPP